MPVDTTRFQETVCPSAILPHTRDSSQLVPDLIRTQGLKKTWWKWLLQAVCGLVLALNIPPGVLSLIHVIKPKLQKSLCMLSTVFALKLLPLPYLSILKRQHLRASFCKLEPSSHHMPLGPSCLSRLLPARPLSLAHPHPRPAALPAPGSAGGGCSFGCLWIIVF